MEMTWSCGGLEVKRFLETKDGRRWLLGWRVAWFRFAAFCFGSALVLVARSSILDRPDSRVAAFGLG
jgi:hypothetical protein